MADKLASDANITTKRESVEVITPDGSTLSSSGAKNLSDIFDKIEGGSKSAEAAIKEVMSSKPEPTPEPKKEEKAPDTKPEPTKEDTKPEDKPEEKVEDKTLDEALTRRETPKEEPKHDVTDEELTVLPSDKPKTAKRIQALLTKLSKEAEVVATTKKEAEEKAAKVAELEKKLAEVKTVDPKTEEEIKTKLDELAQFRRRYQLENDPEIKAKYDSRIEGADEAIYKTLVARGAGEGLIKLIKEEGGWDKFSDSTRIITLADGSETTAAELAQSVLKALPYSEQRSIDASSIEKLQAAKDKQRFIQEEQAKAKEYFDAQEKQRHEAVESQKQYIESGRKALNDFQARMLKENDWLKPKEIPAGATAEQKALITEDNEWAKQINAEMVKYANSKDMTEILAAVENAVKYHHERHLNARLTAENKALKARVESLRSGSRSISKAGSLIGGGTSAPEVKAKDNKPKSLEDALNRIETGEGVDAEE